METADVMGASISRDFDQKAAFVVILFAIGVVVAASVLSEQAADLLRLSYGVSLPLLVVPLPLPVGRITHGGHGSRVVAPGASQASIPQRSRTLVQPTSETDKCAWWCNGGRAGFRVVAE
jgi:hypothetical protein